MFKKSLLVSIAALALCTGALASCGGSSKKEGTLYVCVYDGGYGTEWIDSLAKKYEEQTGVRVEWEANASILSTIENQLTGVPDFDIYMSHDINWKEYAKAGLLENLDDLYESDVKVGSSTKKFKDRVVADAINASKLDGHFYKVCYTQGVGGLVYNADMFRENNWEVPTTYAELQTLCQTIVDANIKVGRDAVAPIAWGGSGSEFYWDYVVYEWWAELAGLDGDMGINNIKKYVGPTGKYHDGYEMYNPATYGKSFNDAYSKFYDLISLNPKFSVNASHANNLATAQAYFNAGKAAMIPYAQWAKYELSQANGSALDFDIAMMKTPKLSASSPTYNYNVGFGDTMLIPAKISDESKELAKDFLRFLASPEGCHTFTEKSQGAFLAFDYNDVQLGDLVSDTFIKSVYDKITQSTNFNVLSDNPMAYTNANSLMPWVNNYYVYSSSCANKDNFTPALVGAELYRIAQEKWAGWMRSANLNPND